jgi:hypothetical protein
MTASKPSSWNNSRSSAAPTDPEPPRTIAVRLLVMVRKDTRELLPKLVLRITQRCRRRISARFAARSAPTRVRFHAFELVHLDRAQVRS